MPVSSRPMMYALTCLMAAIVCPQSVRAQLCQNQAAVDACLFGCSATGEVCDGACGAARLACRTACNGAFDTCDFGCDACDVGCDGCCLAPSSVCDCSECRDGCDDCRDGCSSARSSCLSACDLDCSNCRFDCESGCPECVPFKKIGESCIPLVDRCASGSLCWPGTFRGESVFRCFPEDADVLIDETCLSMHSPPLHDLAINQGIAMSHGRGAALTGVAGGVVEVGTVYGPDGCYGCYTTTCLGAETNIEINAFASLGQYVSLDDFPGRSIVEVGSAGVEIISVAIGQVISPASGEIVGGFEALALGLSVVPITFGIYDCDTALDIVGCLDGDGNLVRVTNNPPVARCADVITCVDTQSGVAEVDVDDGSFDPDRDSVTFEQNPPGPYGTGIHTVTLTVTDSVGAADSCTAEVMVEGTCHVQGLCGTGMSCTTQAPVLGITLFLLCGVRLIRSRRGL